MKKKRGHSTSILLNFRLNKTEINGIIYKDIVIKGILRRGCMMLLFLRQKHEKAMFLLFL